jgi:GIY-YIG catalytic domain-containing protein
MGARSYYVYILANRIGGTLYIGVTNDLVRRVYAHKSGAAESFTKDHDVNRLVCIATTLIAVGPRTTKNQGCRPPRKRGTQYSRGVRDKSRGRGVLGRPVKPGDDSARCSGLPH